jgi:16S rRNA (uracil1498-N3)-methyltransferase
MLSLFFVPSLPDNGTVPLDGDEAHHALVVARLGVGEELLLSDGAGAWARGRVSSTSKRNADVEIIERGLLSQNAPRLTVVQGIPKSDRIKETIELLTEAGVDRIIPWSAARSIAKFQSDSLAKWQSGAFAAAKQSRRFWIPEVTEARTTAQLATVLADARILVLHESATATFSQSVDQRWSSASEIAIVIGPEGGISDDELAAFTERGATVVSMGTPVFRSAHAGIAALSALQTVLGRW